MPVTAPAVHEQFPFLEARHVDDLTASVRILNHHMGVLVQLQRDLLTQDKVAAELAREQIELSKKQLSENRELLKFLREDRAERRQRNRRDRNSNGTPERKTPDRRTSDRRGQGAP